MSKCEYKDEESNFDPKYCPEIPCRWRSYTMYRLVLVVYFLNEASIIFASAEMGHGQLPAGAAAYLATVLLVGAPIVYSEICIAQFTNCSFISLWNYFPVLRGFGYGMIFLIILRTIYLNVLASWYLLYTFYAANSPPPWFSCDSHNITTGVLESKCMVKWINVSLFQHCIEAQMRYNQDCEAATASNHFFMNEIGVFNTQYRPKDCFHPWKPILASISVAIAIFFLALKQHRFLQWSVQFVFCYVLVSLGTLVFTALCTDGGWSSFKAAPDTWEAMGEVWAESLHLGSKALLGLGPGSGMLSHLARDARFRSPANMTALAGTLCASAIVLGFAFVLFVGVRNMSFYHGEADHILEEGESLVYQEFGSVSEILSYLNQQYFWGFLWYSCMFSCLFINIWIMYAFLNDLIFTNFAVAKQYHNTTRFIIKVVIITLTLPFYCCDLFETLMDVVDIIQLVTSLVFSTSLYWVYGFRRHSVDITFMIGVKASMYWRVTWLLNPLLVAYCVVDRAVTISLGSRSESRDVGVGDLTVKTLVFYLLVALYVFIVVMATIFELFTYRFDGFKSFFIPTSNWGPKDRVLYKSRKMFIPEIMTTEFLYRQVRIRGYRRPRHARAPPPARRPSDDPGGTAQWSALTSN